jgi:hypothetical protein
MAAGWKPSTGEGVEDTVSVQPTTATRVHETAKRANDGGAPATAGGDGSLLYWVERYAPADRPTQRSPSPAPLLPPQALLEMPEQDLS